MKARDIDDAQVIAARRKAWLILSLTSNIGPTTARRAAEAAFGSTGALKFSHAEWAELEGVGTYKATKIVTDLPRAMKEADQVLERCQALGIQFVTLDDDNYPALARDLYDAPPVLYYRGTLEPRDLNAVAMVGSRKCSIYGREQAGRLASLLAGAGVTVVSGGARGVDSASHEGALRVPNGRTIAVLGCGVDVVYPPENKPLFDRIAAQGCLLSHYPPGTEPNARHFPERNRVISALSRGTLVIEADERSGSLITARIAADDHNRPVMALPGRVDNPLSAGPHSLLKNGAALITSLDDILQHIEHEPLPHSATKPRRHVPAEAELFHEPAPTPQPEIGLSPDQRTILTALKSHQEAPADTLIESTGLPAAIVLRELTLLTLKGKVRRVDAQTYAVK